MIHLNRGVPATAPVEPVPAAAQSAGAHPRERALAALGGAVTALLLAGLVGWAGLQAAAPPAPRPALSIVVLPFVQAGAGAGESWFADSVSNDLAHGLARTVGTQVISADTARTFRGRASDPRAVARELAVRWVVAGSVRRDGSRAPARRCAGRRRQRHPAMGGAGGRRARRRGAVRG